MKGDGKMKKQAKHALPVVRIAALMISLLLMISVVPLTSAAETPDSPSASKYSITEKMTYDVTVGSEEWDSMDIEQRRNVFRISEKIYTNMSTEALLLTILDNGFIIMNLYFSSSINEGLRLSEGEFPEMTELLAREDFLCVAMRYLSPVSNDCQIESIQPQLPKAMLKRVVDYCSENEPERYYVEPETGRHWEYVKTPNNSNVKAYLDSTYADNNTTYSQAIEGISYAQNYFNAVVVAPCDSTYNCHSYAWYLPNTSNNHWIKNPTAYMTDGSYSAINTPTNGCKVYYDNGNINDNHSGIITYESGTYYVISKWGCSGLLKTTITNIFYYHAGATNLQYWN